MTDKSADRIAIVSQCLSLKTEDDQVKTLPILIADVAKWCGDKNQTDITDIQRAVMINQLNSSLYDALPCLESILEQKGGLLALRDDLVEQLREKQKEIESFDFSLKNALNTAETLKQRENEYREKQRQLAELEKIKGIPKEKLEEISEKIETLIANYPGAVKVTTSTNVLLQDLQMFQETLEEVQKHQVGEKGNQIESFSKKMTALKTEVNAKTAEITRLKNEIINLDKEKEEIDKQKIRLQTEFTKKKETLARHYEENKKAAEGISNFNLPEDLETEFNEIDERLKKTDKSLAIMLGKKNATTPAE